MTRSRFSFPQAELVSIEDTSTHEIDVVKIKEGGHVFLLDMIRRAGLPFEGDFLVASVNEADGGNLWQFRDANHTGLGLLASTTEGAVIALVGSGKKGAVERIVPLQSLVSRVQPDVARMVMMKEEAATFLRRDYVLTAIESKMFEVLVKRRRAMEAEAKARAEAERQRVREERVHSILAREPLLETAIGGVRRSGIPVVEREWPMLPDGTRVVLVDDIGENGLVGNPLQAFVVMKVPGREPCKGNVAKLVQYQAAITKSTMPQPLRSELAERDGNFHEVRIYRAMDDIRKARASGLNGGTMVAVEPEAGKVIEVFAVYTDEVRTLGKFTIV